MNWAASTLSVLEYIQQISTRMAVIATVNARKKGSAQESEQVIDWRGFANGEVFRTL